MPFCWTNPYWVIMCGETYLLVSWCVGGRCDMVGNDDNWGRSRRLGAEDRGWLGTSRVLSGWMIGRTGDAVCDLHRTRVGDGFSMVWPQNHYDSFLVWASKPRSMVWRFGPQNHCDVFLVWTSKPRSTVWWFGLQNHHNSFFLWASKPSGRRFVGLRLNTNEQMKTM
jgi:hypothetical protein